MRHLLDIADLSVSEINELIALAEDIAANGQNYAEAGKGKKLAVELPFLWSGLEQCRFCGSGKPYGGLPQPLVGKKRAAYPAGAAGIRGDTVDDGGASPVFSGKCDPFF